MTIEEFLKDIGITKTGSIGEDGAYVIDLLDSNEYGRIFSTLEKSTDLDILEDNQVVTEQGSSLIYESDTEPYLLNLIADFDGDVYQLVVNNIEE